MRIYIKYMVCVRCKMAVCTALEELGLEYNEIGLGVVDVKNSITQSEQDQLKAKLQSLGLELMDNKKAILIEKIKHTIIEMIHYGDELPKIKNSDYLAGKLNYDYTYLANLFTEVTGITIEHYIIAHKIERVKELLLYDELNLTEISYKLNYTSVSHLSKQFKKVTGLTPTFFKSLKYKKRLMLENV